MQRVLRVLRRYPSHCQGSCWLLADCESLPSLQVEALGCCGLPHLQESRLEDFHLGDHTIYAFKPPRTGGQLENREVVHRMPGLPSTESLYIIGGNVHTKATLKSAQQIL